MNNNFNDVFEQLPHVQSIWLMPNGDWFLHPKKGATEIHKGEEKKPRAKSLKASKIAQDETAEIDAENSDLSNSKN